MERRCESSVPLVYEKESCRRGADASTASPMVRGLTNEGFRRALQRPSIRLNVDRRAQLCKRAREIAICGGSVRLRVRGRSDITLCNESVNQGVRVLDPFKGSESLIHQGVRPPKGQSPRTRPAMSLSDLERSAPARLPLVRSTTVSSLMYIETRHVVLRSRTPTP